MGWRTKGVNQDVDDDVRVNVPEHQIGTESSIFDPTGKRRKLLQQEGRDHVARLLGERLVHNRHWPTLVAQRTDGHVAAGHPLRETRTEQVGDVGREDIAFLRVLARGADGSGQVAPREEP